MLEQLTVVDEATGGVSEQCSPNRMPFLKEDNNSDIHIQEDNTVEENKKIGIYLSLHTYTFYPSEKKNHFDISVTKSQYTK